MDESSIRSAAALNVGAGRAPAPQSLITAMVRFEQRYGGLAYRVVGGNDMEYGLDGDPTGYPTPLGLAFAGIVDGDWTAGVDVLIDGRTAMGPGRWPHRVIDRSVDQRLEKHALLVSVRQWPHQTFTCVTPTGVAPLVPDAVSPPPMPAASGPADLWFSDETTAVEISLSGWPPEEDQWTIRYFARSADLAIAAQAAVVRVVSATVTAAHWCDVCGKRLVPGETCLPSAVARAIDAPG